MRNLLLILLLIIVAAVFSNPSLEKHQEVVRQKMENMKDIDGEVTDGDLKRIGALIGDAIGLNTVEKYLNNNVKIKDLKVCSLTEMKVQGEYKTIGIGAFGNVWLMDDLKGIFEKE